MTAIKLILIVAILSLLVWAFRNRQRAGMRAGLRLLAVCVGAFAILSIADPAITTRLANLVGVGRGTDLLLYVAVITFGVSTVGLYIRSRRLEQRVNCLARALAINAAIAADGAPECRNHPSQAA